MGKKKGKSKPKGGGDEEKPSSEPSTSRQALGREGSAEPELQQVSSAPQLTQKRKKGKSQQKDGTPKEAAQLGEPQPQEVQQPQDAPEELSWRRGPQQRQEQQRRGPAQQHQGPPQQRQGPPQQSAWPTGPQPGHFEQPQGPPQELSWRRDPQPRQEQWPQSPPPQPGWPRGPQPGQMQWPQGPPQQPGWPRGPQPGQMQQPQGPPQQPGWPRGPQPGQMQPRGPPQQSVRYRGPQPGQMQQPQGPPQQPGWPRGPQPGQVQLPQGPPQQSVRYRGPQPGQVQQSQGPPHQQHQVSQQQLESEGKGTDVKKEKTHFGTPDVGFQFTPRISAQHKSGRPIKVAANFFPLIITDTNIIVYHYDVEIDPDKPKHLIREVWREYMKLMFPRRLVAFDGRNAFSKGPLVEEGTPTSASVTVFNEENRKEKEFKVSISEVRKISFSCFHNYRARMLQDRSLKILPEAEITVLDIILRNWACDNFVRSNRTFFHLAKDRPESKDLSKKLSVRFGFFQSAFLGYSPYLNFDIAHKAFYKDLPVLDVLECFRQRHTKELDVEAMNHFIRGVKVAYQLPNDPSSCRVFRANKLVNDARSQKFRRDDGKELTVAMYFEQEKKIRLRYPELPLLWVGPNQKSIFVPMEFCRILPDQIYQGFVDPYETREMVQFATSNARERLQDVMSVFKNTNINSHPLMKEFGLKVMGEMERVGARVLQAPDLKTTRNVRVNEGVWRINNFLEPVTLNRWCVLILDKQVSRQSVMNLQRFIKEKGTNLNMRIAEPCRQPIEGNPSIAALKKDFSQLKDMDLVFVIISEAKGVYAKVKAICETQEGVLTQCIKARTVSQDPRKLSTTIENILLKVNAKLGGKNHCLDVNSVPPCLKGYVMVIGADVTHPSPGMNIPSVAAVTVSCDTAAFQYGTTTRVQPKGEMIRDLEEIISIHVKKFYQLRRAYPEKIIFFRDGVSEGEMVKVLKGELTAVKKACQPYCQPKITFVVVQKRHHTRFFPTSSSDEQGRNYNVPVGTCVDSDIVHPRELEFYLVSHASILGTARPTRYRLLHDDNQLTDDELERLSYYLCHLFARCNRSVSYPSPTYNAHLAAARVRAHLEGLNLLGGQDIDDIKRKMPDRISSISPMYFV